VNDLNKVTAVRHAKQLYNEALSRHKAVVEAIANNPYTPAPPEVRAMADSCRAVLVMYRELITAAGKL
jgi:hypothetical protein